LVWAKEAKVSQKETVEKPTNAASTRPHKVENADQTSGFVYHEYDEPEVAHVATRRRGTPVGALNIGSYGSSQILASSVTSMSNARSGRPPICRSALVSRYVR
jgi:hypothetical protein